MDVEIKKSLLGYNVSDVHDCLERIEKKMKVKLEQKEEKYKQLEGQMEKLRSSSEEKTSALETEKTNLQRSLDAALAQNQELNAQIAKLQEEKRSLREDVQAFEKERSSISEALICAQNQAKIILEDTRQKAAQQQLAFEEELSQAKQQADQEIAALKAQIYDMTDELILLRSSALKVVERYQCDLDYLISEFGQHKKEEHSV